LIFPSVFLNLFFIAFGFENEPEIPNNLWKIT
jgi:hypothetical protein